MLKGLEAFWRLCGKAAEHLKPLRRPTPPVIRVAVSGHIPAVQALRTLMLLQSGHAS